jgi:hypothetical protein
MRSAAHLSIESMCRLGQVSRAGFYRHWKQREPRSEEMELRAAMQQIVPPLPRPHSACNCNSRPHKNFTANGIL